LVSVAARVTASDVHAAIDADDLAGDVAAAGLAADQLPPVVALVLMTG
jgi:hypothetical protein